MSEPDIWTSLEADRLASATYDPLRGMSLEQAAGMDTRHFPVESYVPEPDWLTSVYQPWDNFADNLWGTAGQVVEYSSAALPKLLWEKGLRDVGLLPKQRVVDEGAGVKVLHTQAPQAGGAPAQPTQVIIPGKFPTSAPLTSFPPPTGKISAGILVIVGVIVFIVLVKK